MSDAKGLLRHAFHGTYSATIGLAFDSAEACANAIAGGLAAHGFAVAARDPRVAIAHLDSEGLARFKVAHAGRFTFPPCGFRHCPSDRCSARDIDACTHSVDVGPAFVLHLDPAYAPPPVKRRKPRTRRAPPEQVTIAAIAHDVATSEASPRLLAFAVRDVDGRAIAHVTASTSEADPHASASRDFRRSRAAGWYPKDATLDDSPDPTSAVNAPEVRP